MRILIAGGAGFIGSAFTRWLINETDHTALVLDKLTYAGNLASLAPVSTSDRYAFVQADIGDQARVAAELARFEPDWVINFAAESHVDRSIDAPDEFIQTNIVGTYRLLDACLRYWRARPAEAAKRFRYHHVSTDEVYGSLGADGLFTEQTPYQPRSPYSASKAASDHLVNAWHHTYGLPTVITNCSNNYGPYHYPEKLIPLLILNALELKPLPIYGAGDQVRDWLYVDDHVRALLQVLEQGRCGETYNIGGHNEQTNIAVVQRVCALLDTLKPRADGQSYQTLITHVADRPGHDKRYAIDASKIDAELGWRPAETFDSGLEKTVRWYLDNQQWVQSIDEAQQARRRRGSTEQGE